MSANEGQSLNYDKIYETWEDLLPCRIRICTDNNGENMWGKLLPDGTYGINNMPLNPAYQWQDIVRSTNIEDEDQLIHRRWNRKCWFAFEEEDTKGESSAFREKIMEALTAAGCYPGFFTKGVGYALFQEKFSDDECEAVITKALAPIVTLKFSEEEVIEAFNVDEVKARARRVDEAQAPTADEEE